MRMRERGGEGGRGGGRGEKRKGACVRDRTVIPVNDTLQVLLNHYVKVQGQVISQVHVHVAILCRRKGRYPSVLLSLIHVRVSITDYYFTPDDP